MLGKYYRFRIKWDADQSLTYDNGARILVKFTPWKLSSGARSDGTQVTLDDDNWATWGAGQAIADEGEVESDVVDNSSDLNWGISGDGYFEMIADQNSTDGTAYLFLEQSPDNTNWPSDQDDFNINDLKLVAILVFSTDAEDEARGVNFEVKP